MWYRNREGDYYNFSNSIKIGKNRKVVFINSASRVTYILEIFETEEEADEFFDAVKCALRGTVHDTMGFLHPPDYTDYEKIISDYKQVMKEIITEEKEKHWD